MSKAVLKKVAIIRHARYLAWSMKAVAAANRAWRRGHPGEKDWVVSRDGLHCHLYHWAIAEGLLASPEAMRMPFSGYVAAVFEERRDEVIEEARSYWRDQVARETRGAGRRS